MAFRLLRMFVSYLLCHHYYVHDDWLRPTDAFTIKAHSITSRQQDQQLLPSERQFDNVIYLSKQNRIPTPTMFPLSATVARSSSSSSCSNVTSTKDSMMSTIWNEEQIIEYANEQGVVISLSTLGPGYRAIARAKHNTTQIMGYIEGFIRPGKTILHLDKMEVFAKMVQNSRRENPQEFKGGGTILGVGLLLGYLCLLHGRKCQCQVAEFLAIDDDDKQHQRLVKFYKTSGFQYVKYVGDNIQSIPDRLIWGGCGTLLRNDIMTLLQFWTTLLEKSNKNKKSNVPKKIEEEYS